jgi:hypothetical protein
METCIPPGTRLLVRIDLARLRSAPLYSRLPAAFLAVAEPFRSADRLLIASEGSALLIVARGDITDPPAGSVRAGSRIVLAGPDALVQAAVKQHKSGRSGASDLTSRAETAPPDHEIAIVVRGDVPMALSGDMANVKRLLGFTTSAVLSAGLHSGIEMQLSAECPDGPNAIKLEETLRAFLTLTAAAHARDPVLAPLLRSITVTRNQRDVHAAMSATEAAAEQLLSLLTR